MLGGFLLSMAIQWLYIISINQEGIERGLIILRFNNIDYYKIILYVGGALVFLLIGLKNKTEVKVTEV